MNKDNFDFLVGAICFLGFMFWVVVWLMQA